MSDEERYTLTEAARILQRGECAVRGHDIMWKYQTRYDPIAYPDVDQSVKWYSCCRCSSRAKFESAAPSETVVQRAVARHCDEYGHELIRLSQEDLDELWPFAAGVGFAVCRTCTVLVSFWDAPELTGDLLLSD